MNAVEEKPPISFSTWLTTPYKGLTGLSASPLQRAFAGALVALAVFLTLVGMLVLVVPMLHPMSRASSNPVMPITVTYRGSVLAAGGYVAQFHNTSNKFLRIDIKIESPTMGVYKTGMVEIPAFSVKEIGWAEGWKFASGDKIMASETDYKKESWTIP